GVLHEYIDAPKARQVTLLKGVCVHPHPDGARSSDPHKYRRDALTLENALLDEPGNSRYVFYLAQSYREAGEFDMAIKYYEKRAEMGGWDEEVWYSMYQNGLLKAARHHRWEEIMPVFLKAFDYRPTRAEPLHKIAQHYRELKNYHVARLFSERALSVPYPDDLLFVEYEIYGYLLAFGYAVDAYWTGDWAESVNACNPVISKSNVPAGIRHQAIKNRGLALAQLFPVQEVETVINNKIKVAVISRNPGNLLDNCISSLVNQDYENFEVVFIDNASSDASYRQVPVDIPHFTLTRNETPRAMKTLHDFFTTKCAAGDIVIVIQGTGWLVSTTVLSTVNTMYNEYGCQVLYGQHRNPNGAYGDARPYANESDFSELEKNWFPHALLTFKASAYHKLNAREPGCSFLKDGKGNWRKDYDEKSLLAPVMKTAGFDSVRFSGKVLQAIGPGASLS
ncbi:MAG: glycosyltransferase, partial [bacterium]|nr:glycosyltransferase [bacterium]